MKHSPIKLHEALLLWAEKKPAADFIHTAGNSPAEEHHFTFAETRTITENLAGFFIAHRVAANSTICLLLPRTPELIFTFLAASMTGSIPAPVNYLENDDTVLTMISSLAPAAIVVDTSVISSGILDFISQYNGLIIAINTSADQHSFCNWQSCISHARSALPAEPSNPEELAYLNFTTGTSGFPKGALCSHANIYWNTRSATETFQLTPEDVHLCMFASFSHPHELFSRALYSGASLVLLTRISPRAIVNTINRFKVSCMMGLAVMYKMMAEHCAAIPLPSLRIAESGGMFTNPEIHAAFLAAFKLPILSVWGSTETTGVAMANRPDDFKTNGSMGKPCPWYAVKLVDDAGQEVAAGEIGELLFSGPANVSGYDRNRPLPGQDSWYASGDLATQDSSGFYYFIERKSGMIKVAGLKVYPLQLEIVLQKHPAVREVAVIGVRDKRRGCIPRAFIASEDGSPLDWDELTDFCKKYLAPYMVPKQFTLMSELPKIGSGKINKKALYPKTDPLNPDPDRKK